MPVPVPVLVVLAWLEPVPVPVLFPVPLPVLVLVVGLFSGLWWGRGFSISGSGRGLLLVFAWGCWLPL